MSFLVHQHNILIDTGVGGDIRAVLGSVPSKWSHCCCIDGNTTVYKMLLNEVYHDNAILYLKPNGFD